MNISICKKMFELYYTSKFININFGNCIDLYWEN